MPENTHKDNAQAKPKPKKRQPVKKHDPHAERLAATFAVLGCLAAGATGLMMYYHLDAPLVWTSFLMVVCFLIAIHFHWRIQVVKRLCIIVAVLVFLGCLIWQHRLTAFKS